MGLESPPYLSLCITRGLYNSTSQILQTTLEICKPLNLVSILERNMATLPLQHSFNKYPI